MTESKSFVGFDSRSAVDTEEFWTSLESERMEVPISFLHWRTIQCRAGSATWWIKGPTTGFTVNQFAKVTPNESQDDFKMRLNFRCRPGAFIFRPKNVKHFANIAPVEYIAGAGVEPFEFEENNIRNFRADHQMNPGLVTYAVAYKKDRPKYSWINLTGLMNQSYYSGPEVVSERAMFCTGEFYARILGLSNRNDHVVPLSGDDYGELTVRTRMMADQAAEKVSTGVGVFDKIIPGSCPMGKEFSVTPYVALQGPKVMNVSAPFGLTSHPYLVK